VPAPKRPSRSHRVPPTGGQVGRRPPQPFVPIITGLMWIAVGATALIWFDASWRYVVGIFAIGVGLLFLRGGLAAIVRQNERRSSR
jgi:hypothetical protein